MREVGTVSQHRDHANADSEGFDEFPADPIVRVIDSAPDGSRVGGGQPTGPDDGQHHPG
jgi:hypothetical protein